MKKSDFHSRLYLVGYHLLVNIVSADNQDALLMLTSESENGAGKFLYRFESNTLSILEFVIKRVLCFCLPYPDDLPRVN